jgi:hypothetical protein
MTASICAAVNALRCASLIAPYPLKSGRAAYKVDAEE